MLQIQKDLRKSANPRKAKVLQRFFKTGPGQYGEGDVFLGITVPESRKIARKYENSSFQEIEKLLESKVHEERLVALLILVEKYNNISERQDIIEFYLKNTKYINNWDLVDLSSDKILGEYLLDKEKSVLYNLAKSNNIWERRIAIVSTYSFIKNNEFNETIKISKMLLDDKHDLIHKAVGWMLREVGKRDLAAEELFLRENYKKMPRTMLRYAIERFPEAKRKAYLNGEI